MSAPKLTPAGPVPQFFRNLGGHPGAAATLDEWRLLRKPDDRYAPLPERSGDLPEVGRRAKTKWLGVALEVNKEPHGPARLGRESVTVTFPVGPAEVDRVAPLPDLPTERGVWKTTAILPERWRPGQLAEMFRAALTIVRQVNLDVDAPAHRVFRDTKGRWWALPDRPLRGTGFRGRGPDRRGPDGLPRWDGTWLEGPRQPEEPEVWYLYSRDPEPEGTFLADLGGEEGPLEWAFEVASRLNSILDQRRLWRDRRRQLRALMGIAEWRALSQAARASDNPDLLDAIHNLEDGVIRGGAGLELRKVFDRGFELGDALAFSTAANLVRKSEDDRSRKADLRAALLAIAAEEAAKGPLKPYALARVLIEERSRPIPTERVRRLCDLGLPASVNRIGLLITEVAAAAGLC